MDAHGYAEVRTLRRALFGKVKLARRLSDDCLVAVKLLSRRAVEEGITAHTQARVREDARAEIAHMQHIAAAGGHPNVLALIEAWEDDEWLYIVLEYCGGGELFDLVQSAGRFPEPRARQYFAQLAAGLAAIHGAGVCHRDMSLENVLVHADGSAKICDFGLSQRIDGGQRMTTAVGKAFYMAPEMYSRRPHDGAAADVWSLGVILFIMVAGVPPCSVCNSTDSRFRLVAAGQLGRLVRTWGMATLFPMQLMDLVERMLVPNPGLRISLDAVLRHGWLDGEGPAEAYRRAGDALQVGDIQPVVASEEEEEEGGAEEAGAEGSSSASETGAKASEAGAEAARDLPLRPEEDRRVFEPPPGSAPAEPTRRVTGRRRMSEKCALS